MLQKNYFGYIVSRMEEKYDITQVLAWYIQSGVDTTCGDECCLKNQNKSQLKPVTSQSEIKNRLAVTTLSQTTNEAYKNARDICLKASNLSELKLMVENFEGCALKLTAKSTVFGSGNEKANIMLIGEAPGADEDRLGLPFVGRSGHLLDKMLNSIGIARENVYITNILPWRPPGNRTPTDSEIAVCLPFLKRQIDLIMPKIVLLLGGSAANAVLDNNEPISKLRGHWLEYTTSSKENILALATFHPAFLLRNSAQKSKAWADFLRVLKKLKEN
ncbi:MAG: uracil-DNA glycosylase [Alphaproteobacteria bacterium]|nr:uracil-DNA glycosylase [Alphaproteobacteria bacterium]